VECVKLHLDFETRSEADLETVGAIAYAQHPSTEVLCMGYAFDDEPVVVLTHEQVKRSAFVGAAGLRDDVVIEAWNAPFEDAIWEYVMHRKYGYPAMREPGRWSCVMARALMVGLPGKMEEAARVLQLPFQKDLEGRRAMLSLSKPRGYDVLGDPIWNNDPADFAKMYAYNGQDVEVERAASKVLPQMLPHERAIWEQDLIMNRRGVAVDLELARKAAKLARTLTGDLNGQLRALTGGFIDKATQIARIKVWLARQGLPEFLPKGPLDQGLVDENGEETEQAGLDKAAMLALLERKDLSPLVRQVISIRQQVGKSSTSKYVKTIEASCADGRVRGVLQYHAAHTGREGGRLIQPQNYPKGFVDDKEKGVIGEVEQRRAIDAILADDAAMFDLIYGTKGMEVLSDTLRGTIIAGKGKKLVSADFNSIELCVEMWLAGDGATLNLLRAGGKPYVEMAQEIYSDKRIKKDTHPKQYDLGKRAVLGCGFGLGAPKFKLTCKIQANLDIDDDLAKRAVDVYRAKYPLIVKLWDEIERAAIAAVQNPGQTYATCGGRVLWTMSRDRRFLVAKLPSGRFLWYWKPFVRMGVTPWGQEKLEMCYWGKHPKTKQWCVLKTYGGLLTENVTQAVARDLMAHGLINCEKAGFEMLLTVHDELLGEDDGVSTGNWSEKDTLDKFLKTMCKTPDWAKGCPVAAEGWIGERYRK
jgi:DNA polymerase